MQDISWIFVASLLLLRCSATIAELNVNISVDYNPPPGFTPGPNEYRAASGPVIVTCTAKGPETGAVSYWWSSTCRDCPFQSSKRGSTLRVIRRGAVHSGDNGIHTCSASNDKSNGSASITFIVVGVGIHVFDGNPFGSFPNNGLIISSTMNQSKVFYTFRFFCRSNSMEANVGYLIGLNEENITTDNHFTIDNPQPGELEVINGTQNLTTSEQGVYTCRIPLRNGTIKEINIGVYPNGFKTKPNITNLMFSPGNTSSNLTCTSTGSPATNVTWMRDGQPLTIDGSIYQQIQRVTNRTESTYENILITNNQLTAVIDHNYTCKINNTLGVGVQDIVIPPIVTITEHGTPTAGETSFSLNCTAVLPNWAHVLGKPSIEFTKIRAGSDIIVNDTTVMVDNSTFTRIIQFTPLQISHGGDYICQAIFNSTTVARNISFTVEIPNVPVVTSANGSETAGEPFSITCSANISENLEATSTVKWLNSDNVTVVAMSTDSTAVYTRPTLKASDAGLYTCVVNITSPYLDSPLMLNDTVNITVQIPPPELTVTSDPDASATVYQGDNLTLICTIQLDTAVDIPVIVVGQLSGHCFENTTSEKPYRFQKTITATTSDNFTCTATINPTPDTTNVQSSEEVCSILAVTVDLNVIITVDYNPPPGFTPGLNEYRAASGPVTVTCIVTGGIGNITYQWSSTCNACPFKNSNSTSVLRRAVNSRDSGNHTCTACDNNTGSIGKASIKFNVTGYGIYICHGEPRGALSNNELTTFLEHANDSFYFRLYCHSDSVMENVGELIGLDNMTVLNSSFFTITNSQPGELEVVNKDGFNQTSLPDLKQGIYTCRIPLENMAIKEINIGIYSSGFNTTTSIIGMEFTFGLPSTLTCTSTGSPAMNVTWMKDGQPLNTHTGSTYHMTQNVTNRKQSTYENVLFISDSLTNIVNHTYTCNVSNVLGSALENHTVTAPNVAVMTSAKGSGTAGEEYSIICDVNGADDLDAEYHLMWIAQSKSEVVNQTRNDNHLTHTFRADIADAGLYTCIANITYLNSSLILNNTISITIKIPTPTVSITRGSETPIYAGSNLSLICTITLNGIPMVALSNITVNSSWAGPFEKANERATSDVIRNNTVFTSTLMVTMLHISDTGNYSCRAIISHTSNLILSSETGLKEDIIVVEAPVLSVETSTKGSGVAGETLTICCFVNGTENLAANFTLTWMDKNGNIVKRYTGRDSNLTHTFNPKVSDAGLYVCSSVITSPYLVDKALSRNETLNVRIQAQNVSDVSVMTSSEGSATAGEEYSIICKVNGADNLDAEFHLMWIAQNKSEVASQRRNDGHLSHNFTADIADAGLYTCIANITSSYINSSLIVNTTMNITIQIPTPTVSITHGSETPIYAGSNLSLICTITLNGIPVVALGNITVDSSWMGPNEKSIEGVRIATSNATQKNDTAFKTTLMITTLHISDNGNYSCRATVGHISDLILSSKTGLKEKLIAVTVPDVSVETFTRGSRIAGEPLTLCCFINGIDNLAANVSMTWMDKNGNTVQNYTGRDSNLTHTFTPKVSDAGPYVCSGIVTSPYLDDNALDINGTLNVSVQISRPTLNITRDPDANVTLRHGDSLNLTCTIQLGPAVDSDVVVTGELSGPGGTTRNPTMVSDKIYQMKLAIPSLNASSLETYNCTTVIDIKSGVNVMASEEDYTILNISVELNVNITISYTPPPGVVLGPNEYRAASGPVNITCTAIGGTGTINYQWSSTCRDCPFNSSNSCFIRRGAVHSGDTGIHTCMANVADSEIIGIANTTITVIGAGIHVFNGVPTGSLPNNGLVSLHPSHQTFSLRLFCRSDSMMESVGLFIGLDGIPVATHNSTFFEISNLQPGEVSVVNFEANSTNLNASGQGVYSCCIPLRSGEIMEINVGIYPSGFMGTPAIMSVSFMSGSSSSIFTCSSTGSPATVVIWTVKNGQILTMRDGDSTTAEGINYQLTQTVNNRSESSYTNVLNINTTSVENILEYQCGVMNALGNSDMVNVTGAVIISTDGAATLGRSYTLNCTVIGIASKEVLYEWTGPDPGIHKNSSILTISSIGFQNVGTYMCCATIGSRNIFGTEIVSVRIPKPAVTIFSSAGTIHSDVYTGSVLTLTCTVTINEQVPQNDIMVIISWTNGSTIVSNTTDDERITVSNLQQIGTSLNYTSTIVLNTIRQSDAGEYRCQANISHPSPYVTDGIGSDNHTIITRVPVISVAILNISDDTNVVAGKRFIFICNVSGANKFNGTTKIEWIHPNASLLASSSIGTTLEYQLNKVALTDAGVYTCNATITNSIHFKNEITMSDTQELVISIPGPMVTITTNTEGTIYAGSILELICNIILDENVVENKQLLVVNSRWTGPDGELTNGTRITLTPAVTTSSRGLYISMVTIKTLRKNDTGNYSCMVTVSHSESRFVTNGSNIHSFNINIQDPRVIVSLTSNATRLPNVPPYNTFSLTCTATAPEGVVSPKTFTWWRQNSILNTSLDGFQISNNTLDQAMSTSKLVVTETAAGIWHYSCEVAIPELSIVSNRSNAYHSINVTGTRLPEEPIHTTAATVTTNSATIYWTVTTIAFTPETYVIHYGTSMDTHDSTSDPITENNFTAVKYNFSITLKALIPNTMYFYYINSTNTNGSVLSNVAIFTTEASDSVPTVVVGGAAAAAAVVIVILCIVIIAAWRLKKQNGEKVHLKPGPTVLDTMVVDIELTAVEDIENDKEEGAVVSDIQDVTHRQSIPIAIFGEHVSTLHTKRNEGFEAEYNSISKTPLVSHDVSGMSCNQEKNRFINIYPYDFSRVKLKEIEGVEGSDYINASFLDGYTKEKEYIAAQGPVPETVGDFWRMIWEYKLTTIVMLTKCEEGGKRKCQQYWPDDVNKTLEPGHNLVITLTTLQPFVDFETRKLTVKDSSKPGEPTLEVTHFYYLSWPDHGVPTKSTSLINFIKRVREVQPHSTEVPLLVHCSAGVGRTGTFIAIDIEMQRIEAEGAVDVYGCLKKLRSRRVLMVQTLTQYVFIHEALNELIVCGETDIIAANLRITTNRLLQIVEGKKTTGFDEQFEVLELVSLDANKDYFPEAMSQYNIQKNRYTSKVAGNNCRVCLTKRIEVPGSDYINANFINGYRQPSAYIATQGPMASTVKDFWRMIWERQSRCIVMLCNMQEDAEESCHPYCPEEPEAAETHDKIEVTLRSEEQHGSCIIRKLEIKTKPVGDMAPESITVTQFQLMCWPPHDQPSPPSSLLDVMENMARVQMATGNRPITVMCNDGVGRTGVFICLHAQLERLKTEGVVDCFQFIKSARLNRPGLVQNVEQYILCHEILSDYVDSFDTYANFKELV